MASADFCPPFLDHRWPSSPLSRTAGQTSRDKRSFFRPAPAGFTPRQFGSHGFRCLSPAHPPREASYPVSVRQAVAVAPASFRPRLATTPLPSHNGADSLARRGLSPPRTSACPAYEDEATARMPPPFSRMATVSAPSAGSTGSACWGPAARGVERGGATAGSEGAGPRRRRHDPEAVPASRPPDQQPKGTGASDPSHRG
jgi:hypothetical protein